MEALTRVRMEQNYYLEGGYKLFHMARLHPGEREHLEALIQWFFPVAGAFYADFGCGIGTIMDHLEKVYDAHTVGINISPEQASCCLARGLCIKQGTYTQSGLPDNSVDAVLFMETFGYCDPAETLHECARVLKPGGEIWLKDFFFMGNTYQRKEVYKVWRYVFYQQQELEALFQSYGFSLQWEEFEGHIEHYLEMMMRMHLNGLQTFVPCAGAGDLRDGFKYILGKATRV
jgi:ubiquinone/menaquinone biosynthesis C-methylase UbiE